MSSALVEADRPQRAPSKFATNQPLFLTAHSATVAAMKRVSRRYMGRVSIDHMTHALNGAEHIKISRATVARLMNTVHFKRRTLRVKPLLSLANAAQRLKFARDNLARGRGGRNIHIAHVDIDEKYFTAHEDARLLLPKEDVTPQRSLQSKRNRPKVMLLIVFGEEKGRSRVKTNVWHFTGHPDAAADFDGKIGFYRFSATAVAKRKSKKRDKGDEFEQDVTVDADKYVEVMTQQVIPDIRARMSRYDVVVVQHDGATPHTGQDAEERILKAVNTPGARPIVRLVRQPAQSPDLNVNDIGLLHSINVAMHRIRAREFVKFHQDNAAKGPVQEELVAGIDKNQCGMRNLAQACTLCGVKDSDDDDKEWIQCAGRYGFYHVDCLDNDEYKASYDDAVQKIAANEQDWLCPFCRVAGCEPIGRMRDACVTCGSRQPCSDCRDGARGRRDVPDHCEHWIQCQSRRGWFHTTCLPAGAVDDGVGEDSSDAEDDEEMMEDLDTWDCHICRAIGVKDRRGVRDRNDPDRFKNVTLWADNADSITAAVAMAMQDMKSETIARAFECKTANMHEIVKAEGGNSFKTPHFRSKKRKELGQV
jgi:hypothetical protein